MVLAVEIIVCCLIFGIYRVIRIKRDPAYKISNMPEKLQKKVMHMRGYRNRNIRIMTDWEKFVKKLPTLIFWTISLVILTSIAGATSFSTGFVFALLIWMAVLLFLELVVYCGWYAHTPKVWIKGTEDMAKKTYTNYAHYIGLIPQRALMGIVVAIIVGLVIDMIPRLDNNNYSPKYTEIEDTLKAACDNYRIPGMAVEVVDAEGVLFSGTYGDCKSLDTPFITGSLSKSFTAACIMKLYEEGHLNIDSPVNPYLDAAEVFKNPKDATRITIRQLLNHTSGLGVYQHVGNAKIVGKNGEYTYANVNYDILGLIVEKVSGVSYSDYLTETFFTPLGMTHSSAAYAKAKEDGLITGHNNYFGFSVESDVKYPLSDSWSTVPAGYIASSANDMGKYLQMYLRGGYGILSDKSLSTMFRATVPMDESGETGYGMGWVRSDKYVETVYNHTGLTENYISDMYLLPESGVGVVFLANTNDYMVTNNLMNKVTSKVVMTLMGYATDELDPKDYVDAHLFYDLVFAAFILVALMEIIKSHKWRTDNSGNLIANIFLHLFLPVGIVIAPIVGGIPYWVIKDYVPDLFIVSCLSVVLLAIGGILKLKNRRNS